MSRRANAARNRGRDRAPRPGGAPRPSPSSAPISLHAATAEASPGEALLLLRLTWAVVALMALGLLIMALGPHRVGNYFTETDFYSYAVGARLIEHGRLDPSRYGVVGPVYEVVLAVVGWVVHDLFRAAELISIAAMAGTLLLWSALLRRRADARLALLVVLFLAFNRYAFLYGYSATTDALTMALEAAALLLLLTRSGSRGAALAGMVAGFAFLTRYNMLALLPAGLIAILGGATSCPRRGRGALLFAAGFLAPVAPWVAYSLASGAHFSFQLHHNIAYEVFARPKGIPWDDYQRLMQPEFKSLADVIAKDPGAVASRMVFNLGDHLRLDAKSLLGWPLAACAALGLALGLTEQRFRRLWPLGVTWALLFLTLVPAFYSERYSLALLPFYLLPAGWLFASPRFALAFRGGDGMHRWLRNPLVLVPLVAMVIASVRLEARAIDQLPVEVLEAARVLRSLERPGDRVIARKAHVAFHAGAEPVAFPFASSLPELAAFAHQEHVRWMYFSWAEAEMRPQFWYLLDTTAVVPGLTVRRAMARPHPFVLYEIGPEFGTPPIWSSNDTLLALHISRAKLMVDSTDARSLATLGTIERAHGNYPTARRLLERAAHRNPNDYQIQLALGEIDLVMEDGPGAEAAYLRAQALQPNSADAEIGLGWASLVSGDAPAAAQRWRPVVSNASDVLTLERMLMVFRAAGDRQAADAAAARLAQIRGTP